ncbi:MAG: Coenzyme F420 hydrogenase/dehydrogenase, beta subunit C-terminal domain [Candidatus Peribacteraceae bacterium]|nr:Coenzyme F420 hydrogenase/dehydrogenase, beta subunit C-terminal domain [Candidatus Peribacteraceae bacterium]
MSDQWWDHLRRDVLDCNLCTQCGSCVGISDGTLAFREDHGIVLPIRTEKSGQVPEAAFRACPALACPYPDLNRFVFGKLPGNWLSGVTEGSFVGHATDKSIRRAGASGGVISAILIHLLETKQIVGAVCLQVGASVPYRAEPVIARTKEEVMRCAQSVYSVTPVNTILGTLEKEEGPLAYVGLPDQVASIRKLQRIKHPAVRNITFVLGPYMGTQMTFDAIRSFLRSHGVSSEKEITRLRYRAGEWPGHLEITLKDGRVLTAEKFHYNYLIPFFITRSSLQLVDFTNELTDISVGDAWSPKYESKRGGYSVILARSARAMEILEDMRSRDLLALTDTPLDEALAMHSHMLDFKKRGSFIRMRWMPVAPDYGYRPTSIPSARIFIEWCLRMFFAIGALRISRWAIEHLPLKLVGPVFNLLRKGWKELSKTSKRKGLRETEFEVCSLRQSP